ncbi:signal peptide containing protein [Theileria equi strain WA]|uniref:Signal peptide containing protein n=1 Tax=Theileria equi strain WA TaxID=1537102 RepID=L1LE69_THEEQ|nr:signal peptide containing protein [Theileria equi strain WA]EKX73641.1 signal peptide containing protein [Theileria equi strain WA]|eukprot:XP_004833093.1 signal peptide containing protein [Theileria equi strain WA]
MRFLSVFSVLFLVRLSSCDEVVFDLSSPDPSLARDYKSTVDGVVHHSFFSTGLFFSKVVDGGVTLWEGKGEERCDVLFTSVGDRTRAVLHVWVKGLPSRMLYYEKLDGEWKLVTIRVKGLPESEEPVSPQEHAAELNFANLGCPLGGCSGSEVPSHDEDLGDLDDQDSGETLVEEVQPEVAPAESPEDDEPGKESESDDMGDPSKENEQEARVEETMLEGVTSEDEEPKASEPPKNAEKNVAPTHSQVLEKGEHVSHGLGKSTAGGASLDNIASHHSEVKQESPKKHLQGTSPKDTPKAPTQPGSVPEVKQEQNPATNLQGGAKKEQDEAKEQQPAAKPVTLSERAKKVDAKSFDVRESSSNGVPLLTCTPRSGVVANELKYGDETIWNNSRGSCLSALIYFKGEKPYVVTVQYRENEEDRTLFFHNTGSKWEHNKREHERKLCGLKGLPTPQSAGQAGGTTLVTLDLAHPDRSKVSINDQSSDVMNIMEYTPKNGYHISSVMDGGVEVWTAGTGETSGLVNSYTKGDSSLITIGVDKGDDLEHKHFEKVDGKWREVTLGDFLKKYNEMKGLPKASK